MFFFCKKSLAQTLMRSSPLGRWMGILTGLPPPNRFLCPGNPFSETAVGKRRAGPGGDDHLEGLEGPAAGPGDGSREGWERWGRGGGVGGIHPGKRPSLTNGLFMDDCGLFRSSVWTRWVGSSTPPSGRWERRRVPRCLRLPLINVGFPSIHPCAAWRVAVRKASGNRRRPKGTGVRP